MSTYYTYSDKINKSYNEKILNLLKKCIDNNIFDSEKCIKLHNLELQYEQNEIKHKMSLINSFTSHLPESIKSNSGEAYFIGCKKNQYDYCFHLKDMDTFMILFNKYKNCQIGNEK
jgi:hypothetical protein